MSMPFQKPRILVVDDDPDFVSDMTAFLSSEFDVTSAANTVEARDSWQKMPPRCVLLDMHMPNHFGKHPDSEGLAFLSHVKSQPSAFDSDKVPVIIVTAGLENDGIKFAQQLGISTIYNKPFDIKKLKTSIWSLIGKRGEAGQES